jgi:hypothetical protein
VWVHSGFKRDNPTSNQLNADTNNFTHINKLNEAEIGEIVSGHNDIRFNIIVIQSSVSQSGSGNFTGSHIAFFWKPPKNGHDKTGA